MRCSLAAALLLAPAAAAAAAATSSASVRVPLGAAGSLDIYTPLREWDEGDEVAMALLRQNGGSVGGAFWGICTFESAGDHLCACARVATAEINAAGVSFALASVASLFDAATRAAADDSD